MSHPLAHGVVMRWFFLLLATAVLYLSWKIISPYAIVIATAAIAAVVLAPVEYRIRKAVKNPQLSGVIMLALVLVAIIVPLVIASALLIKQVNDLIGQTIADPAWRANFNFQDLDIIQRLPEFLRNHILAYDPEALFAAALGWLQANLGSLFSSGAAAVFKTFIFFICLYFFLVERKRIYQQMLQLSPLKDATDRNIVMRLVETVRGVVFGGLIVAVVQSIIAAIGLTLFGVPGALIWASLVIITSQIPILGNGLVMVPAVLYLALTGQEGQAVGLAIWAVAAVGFIDNLISPLIVGRRTKMHTLLILLSVLGGLEYFGPIGFIMGPTILAGLLVVLELYRAGILEHSTQATVSEHV